MTPEQLEAQSRAAIKAWCDDPGVRLEYTSKDFAAWMPVNPYGFFNIRDYHYRIAKPKKFYRVAKMQFGETLTANDEVDEKKIKVSCRFIEWLDERKYYD